MILQPISFPFGGEKSMPATKFTSKNFKLFLCRNFYLLLLYNFLHDNKKIELREPLGAPFKVKVVTKTTADFILARANELLVGPSLALVTQIANYSYNPSSFKLEHPFDPIVLDILTDIHFKEAIELLHFYNYPIMDIMEILKEPYGNRDYSETDIESYIYYFYDLSGFSRWSLKDKQNFVGLYQKFDLTRHAYRRELASLTSGLDFEGSLIDIGLKSYVGDISRDYIFQGSVEAVKLLKAKISSGKIEEASDLVGLMKDLHTMPDEFPRVALKGGSPTNFIPNLLPPPAVEAKKPK